MNYILSFVLATTLSSFASANWSKDKTVNVNSSTIEFSKGVHTLTPEQKREIDDVVRKAKMDDDYKVEVAVWSDQPFPAGDNALSSDQQELASQRIDAIKDYMGTLSLKGDMETYSMAEDSNWLSKLFRSSDSELKSAFAKKDMNSNVMKEKYQTFKSKGAPSKAVFVVTKSVDVE